MINFSQVDASNAVTLVTIVMVISFALMLLVVGCMWVKNNPKKIQRKRRPYW